MWSGAFNRAVEDGALLFSSGERVLKGAWDPRKQKNFAVWQKTQEDGRERRTQDPPQGHPASRVGSGEHPVWEEGHGARMSQKPKGERWCKARGKEAGLQSKGEDQEEATELGVPG